MTKAEKKPETAVVAVAPKRSLAEQLKDRSVSNAAWHALTNSLYPGARYESVLLVIDYCRARGLDPLKKPVHIVQMPVKNQMTGDEEWRDVVLAGIYEHRITAHRTGQYLGHTEPKYGDAVDFLDVTGVPMWCSMTMRRATTPDGPVAEFPVRVYFTECVGTTGRGKDQHVNARWRRAPIQMLTKVCEAAGLREAFPEELGGIATAEEVDDIGETISTPLSASQTVQAPPDALVEGLNAELGITAADTALAQAEALAQPEKPI